MLEAFDLTGSLRDAGELASAVVEFLRDPALRATLAGAAAEWRRENGGAVARTLAVLREEVVHGKNRVAL